MFLCILAKAPCIPKSSSWFCWLLLYKDHIIWTQINVHFLSFLVRYIILGINLMLPLQAIDMIRGKNIILLMDSHLEGNFSMEEATLVVDLASQCLQYEPRERPSTKDLVTTLVAPLKTKPDVKKFSLCNPF